MHQAKLIETVCSKLVRQLLLGWLAISIGMVLTGIAAVAQSKHVDENDRHAIMQELEDPLQNSASSIGKQLAASPVVIPFHYGPEGGILLPIQSGSGKADITLDTGCSVSTLWQEARPKSLVTLKDLDSVWTLAKLPDAHLGRVNLGDVKVLVCPRSTLGQRTDSEASIGLLGGNVLRNFDVTIDYQAKTVTLSGSGTYKTRAKNAAVLPLTLRHNQPLTTIILNNKLNLFVGVDTGACENRCSIKDMQPVLGKQHKDSMYVRIDTLRCGKAQWSNSFFRVDNFFSELPPLIGSESFSRFKVTFDYYDKQLILEKPVKKGAKQAAPVRDLCAGNWLLEQGSLSDAVVSFTKVINEEPELAILAYVSRAVAYQRLGKLDQCADDCAHILQDKRTSTTNQLYAHTTRASVFEHKQLWQKAIQELDPAIQSESRLMQAEKVAASSHSSLLQKQVESSRKLLAVLYAERARNNGSLNNNSQSLLDIEKAIDSDPSNAYYRVCCAAIDEYFGNHEKAVAQSSKAISLNPNYADAFERRAEAYESLKQYDKALADYNKAIALKPKLSSLYLARSLLYAKLGNEAMARKDKDTAAKLGLKR